jgi:biopolymer transport protein ExbB/TolQ
VSFSNFLQHASLAGLATLVILLGCSIYIAALARDLWIRSGTAELNGDWLLAQLRHLMFVAQASPRTARAYLASHDRPLGRICSELLLLQPPTLDKGDYLLSTLIDRERGRLEAGLSSLGTVAVIAPFVGLFGTVVGITRTFADVARLGKAGIEVVSAGVSEALVTTAVGLVVAIVSVVLFNAFKARFERQVSDWDVAGRAFLGMLTSSPEEAAQVLDFALATQPTDSARAFALSQAKNPA